MTRPKSFDDATRYERQIRALVPGYDVLHAVIPAMLRAACTNPRRILVVGCGTGTEAIAVARTFAGCEVDCVDPSSEMIEHAATAIRKAGLESRVRVNACELNRFVVEQPYDAVVSTLVGHLIPDDGARASFLCDIAGAMAHGASALVTEIECSTHEGSLLVDAHLKCSSASGVSADRLELLKARLTHGFHMLERSRFEELAGAAHMQVHEEFFRCFNVVGRRLVRSQRVEA
ncbi:hypothetical protein DL240_02815 [Lujinxingia litoralis]|uniref:Methyltransferase domain-containing protein n=1 Tax=Lujinxingia litoralis TaxID=2211119 RepID=A0A328CDR8_9DELT|nr:class I SAM-dependent methyltransferase [Lujinxingia litoralis]RAL25159.1 hypothetical protein DL240_02815 [Lujinxingia litoralis]